ncbi:anthranilate phosphoribosyltransferase [Rappaport israeli]|uniref:anthranilate phosphoribosyltransferase n=1 Tax=Rappaport israeli TaxID=1839807 RepID=UPI0009319566|nr:anthranilate phosphoribosyltransferase [Rappaport israeli]
MNILKKLMQFQELNENEAQEFARLLFSDELAAADKTALLVAMKMKQESAKELTAITHYLINSNYPVQPRLAGSMCVCGTGGDGVGSFNISTTVSFIVASAGVKVLKHGNKGITSKSGGVDLLDALGIAITPIEAVARRMEVVNLAFLSAMNTYPMMRVLQPIRQLIPLPTLFNLMGPMIHPYALDYQMMGVFDASKVALVAQTLFNLGRKRALVIHGAGGMDEASLAGENLIYEINAQDGVRHYSLEAKDYGLKSADNAALKGGTSAENKEITLAILGCEDKSARRDVVLLNAGLALYIAEKAPTVAEGIALALSIIERGEALELLRFLQE